MIYLGFSVYISNTTNKDNGVLCFRDTHYTRATLPNPANITFLTTGDMSSTTTTGFTLRILMTILLTLGLCEFEVYGKKPAGFYPR